MNEIVGANTPIAPVRRAAVIGSGVMGAGIAAHLANAGMQVLLLDVVPDALTAEEIKQGLTLENVKVRNRLTAWKPCSFGGAAASSAVRSRVCEADYGRQSGG